MGEKSRTPPEESDATSGATIRDWLDEHGAGMLSDLIFAVVWVALVTALHTALDGPEWAYYLLLAAGIPAYYVFFISLKMAKVESE